MSGFLHRVGAACAAHPWRVIGAWVAALVLALGLSSTFGGTPQDNYDTPGLASQRATDQLRAGFPEVAGADARVVLHDPDGRLDDAVVTDVSRNLGGVEYVAMVAPPRLSTDGDTALITVYYDRPVTHVGGKEALDNLVTAVDGPTRQAGVTAEFGGQVAENIQEINGMAEAIGIAAALVILLLAFGSVVAAGVPLAVALIGLGIGSAGVTLIAAVSEVSTIAPTIGTMVGLGVGIDYALLLVTRHLEGLRAGLPVREAAANATATSGTSVLFAGATVVLALMGLRLVELKSYSTTGFTTAVVVVAVVATSLTLVPALCGLAGHRLLGKKARRAMAEASDAATAPASGAQAAQAAQAQPDQRLTARWAARVGRRPLPWALGALVVLLALAAPVLDMRTWPQDAGSQSTSTTQRRAYDLIAAEFGAGANAPLLVAADLRTLPKAELGPLAEAIRSAPDVATVAEPVISSDGSTALIVAEPTVGPSDPKASALVRHLRADVLPDGAEITGWTAAFTDISALLAGQLWQVVGFVVGVSLLLLLVVFRSPLVALKAAVMNMLSIAAAYGVIVAVFQWGWGAELLGLPHAVPMSSWLPLLMFAVLFGLSMDYEVFLLSRIREDWLATGDARGSVVRGLAKTGRVITSAGLIMIAVFAGFALDPDVTVKMIGLGMAVAVLVDMTIIRMVLVPATMALLGRANWWLPGWLDRILPRLDLHGEKAGTVTLPAPRVELAKEETPAAH
ncbi:MMPL family transporter [Frankia sp. CNm7]|uniref:MMPL family transporter n=1 Tax=Frankia nepalensis TaxID=1836974 RepID=A0A937UT18_9ACTN|nr:MMPL family transporter [Frankia nepalensis]MBL7499908.1 MMPL family transporter [Frankia nepalensis]MBL7515420.1 MMPL family transporter [Frankia nepalensis]MBL7517868.1 MMPL family transporter [Frankia nepalensis]MBL7633107.1 MMPL family transporter [Frankia nepalensis]